MSPDAVRHYLGQLSGYNLPALDDGGLERLVLDLIKETPPFAFELRLVVRLVGALLEARLSMVDQPEQTGAEVVHPEPIDPHGIDYGSDAPKCECLCCCPVPCSSAMEGGQGGQCDLLPCQVMGTG